MATVKLYKVKTNKAYRAEEQGVGYSFYEPHDTDHYQHEDDGGKLYTLPEGITVHTASDGHITAWKGDSQLVLSASVRGPVFIDPDTGRYIYLKPA